MTQSNPAPPPKDKILGHIRLTDTEIELFLKKTKTKQSLEITVERKFQVIVTKEKKEPIFSLILTAEGLLLRLPAPGRHHPLQEDFRPLIYEINPLSAFCLTEGLQGLHHLSS